MRFALANRICSIDMLNRVSSTKLSFGDIARGVDACVSLKFVANKPLEKSVADQVILVGQSVQSFVQSLAETVSIRSSLVDIMPPATDSQSKGWSGSALAKVDSRKIRAHVYMTPTEASRHNNPFRSESITKSLISQLSDSVAQVGKSDDTSERRVDLICALPSLAALPSTCFAIARAMPRFSRKTERGKDALVHPLVEVRVSFYLESGELIDAASLASIEEVAECIRMSQTLSDTPPNELNPTTYTAFIESLVADLPNVSIQTIRGKELEARGFGGIWSVGKGNTTNPPALVVLSHTVKTPNDPSVVLVGKGITYDSGGLSLKSGQFMCGMKSDMGGSAAMLSSFVALVRMGGIGENLHCVLCLAENSVGPDSFRNDDVLKMYSGLTVEINNTDAEGRLVLADGAAFAVKHLNPRLVLDMATLTGAQGVATGQMHAAILSAQEDEETGLVTAGKNSGDLAFPILYCPEFHRLNYKSEVADMKNSVTNRADAASSASGWFIYDHMNAAGYTGKWAHIDMASPSTFHPSGRATGYGVGLICSYLSTKF